MNINIFFITAGVFTLLSGTLLYADNTMNQPNESRFKFLYAPWRDTYITKEHQKKVCCPFCQQYTEQQDEKNFLVARYKYCFVMLNLHPYTTGHLLIIPARHVATLCELLPEERAELLETIVLCQQALEKTVKVEGFNLGLNQGAVAGAGIPGHLHLHLLPRWSGDTGFSTVTGSTHVINCNLAELYQRLKKQFTQTIVQSCQPQQQSIAEPAVHPQ